ncbi:hypothetical protein DCC85_08460 [Paenibacillus sp. CAA11]|uniref:hypothetical protein n=1 Tax=Paenibacillus sp. CAA11 TaxID=1532905 RepID=UPI000D388521|nr:hypothetical protein [Paenibacillus sp. CAA11]AWB44244.1 hypothetical protein DCC85_08460 [Paenibacillus sp. CAA11]
MIAKKLMITMLAVSSLVSLQPVFADGSDLKSVDEQSMETQAIKIQNTKETAMPTAPRNKHIVYMLFADEEDWFKWTNNTGKPQFVEASLAALGEKNSVRMAAQIEYDADHESPLMIHDEVAKPHWREGVTMKGLYVPDGASIYFRMTYEKFIVPMKETYVFKVNSHEAN